MAISLLAGRCCTMTVFIIMMVFSNHCVHVELRQLMSATASALHGPFYSGADMKGTFGRVDSMAETFPGRVGSWGG